jgi:lysozyme family protein
MAAIRFTSALQKEYEDLFNSCNIRAVRAGEVESTLSRIMGNRARYEAAGDPLSVPWYFVAVVHCMECSLDFTRHLHNGDPLTARTVQVPAGRPATGQPPFSWETSAVDALALKKLNTWTDWTIPGTLFKLEEYNGFGYRLHHPEVLTPYLWCHSNHYSRGKYVADGSWSDTAQSRQCGGAVLLRRMAETGALQFDREGRPTAQPLSEFEPLVRFSQTEKSTAAEELQRALNRFPGIYVKVDGVPGMRTSDAFRKVTGQYLAGDPRARVMVDAARSGSGT